MWLLLSPKIFFLFYGEAKSVFGSHKLPPIKEFFLSLKQTPLQLVLSRFFSSFRNDARPISRNLRRNFFSSLLFPFAHDPLFSFFIPACQKKRERLPVSLFFACGESLGVVGWLLLLLLLLKPLLKTILIKHFKAFLLLFANWLNCLS